MTISRKKHGTQTKVIVVLEALKDEKTTAEITAKYSIHSTQTNNWKKAAIEMIPEAFSSQQNAKKMINKP